MSVDYNVLKIKVHDNGELRYIKFFKNNKLHNSKGPAKLIYNKEGLLIKEYYYIDGKKSRLYAPAVIKYYSDGSPRKLEFFYKGFKHNKYGPAIVRLDKYGNKKYEIYFNMDSLHNLDGPAYNDYIHNKRVWMVNGRPIL